MFAHGPYLKEHLNGAWDKPIEDYHNSVVCLFRLLEGCSKRSLPENTRSSYRLQNLITVASEMSFLPKARCLNIAPLLDLAPADRLTIVG